MDELSKLKKSRGVLRTSITKYLNKIEADFKENLDSFTVTILEESLIYLKAIEKQLKDSDNEIQKLIENEQDFDSEIEAAIEYNQKIIICSSKVAAQLKIIQNKVDPQVIASHISSLRMNENATTNEQNNTLGSSTIAFDALGNRKNSVKTIKLPKLAIDKYYGDPCSWLEFWNRFQNSIDNNTALSKVDKFSYLKGLLGGSAANAINGFALSDENYDQALNLLKQRFGREELVINAHMAKLLNLLPVNDSNNIYGLRKLYDTVEVQIRSLESLKVTSGMFGHLLYPILIKLIPEDLALAFHRKRVGNLVKTEFDVTDLLTFLRVEIECRESSAFIHNSKGEKQKPTVHQNCFSKSKQNPLNRTRGQNNASDRLQGPRPREKSQTYEYLASTVDRNVKCIYCGELHDSENCMQLDLDAKRDVLKKQARCYLCLKPKHRINECRRRQWCENCSKKHNKSICSQLENKPNKNEDNEIVSAISHCKDINTSNKLEVAARSSVLLQTCTAVVRYPESDKFEPVRVLLDNGSMRTFINREISKKLKLNVIRKESLSVYAFGARQAKEQSYNVVRLKLENRDEPSLHIEIEALETEQISATTLPVPETNISKKFNKLKGLQLADCVENKDKNISILIGADYYYEIVSGRLKRLNDKLVATETIFGWCLQGYIGLTNDLLSLKIVVDERNISDQLQQFWKLENLGVGSESQEEHSFDADIMKEFEAGITYQDNRYKVKFPWKSNMKHLLNNNRDIASRRFSKLKSNFINDPPLFSDYKKVIDEHLREDIIERIKDSDENKENTYYLPHRAVIRKDHSTTRLRIVFDASSHAKGQLSLNDCLYTGLNLIPDLFSLLLRFRSHPVAITADIQKAFLQINIDEEDRNFTRFYWSNNPEDGNEEIYRMTRVLFGVCSSPFLLAATIKYHLKRYVEQFPMTCELLENSLYVDDLITGREDIESAFKTSLEAFNIFKDASMNLRKWKTNSVELRDRWRKEGLEIDESNYSVNDNSTLTPCKVLGLSWDSDLDIFYFDAQNLEKFLSRRINTKRYILQVAGRIFDPLGILGPFTIKIKCMIQEIWCLGLDWDDPIPKQLTTAMNEWCEDIKDLHLINIPRYYLADAKLNEVDDVQLHCFSDASKKAYGAVVYIRVVFKNGRIISNFVASKSRVAPLKTLSMPRLELMGALLAARLNSKISKYLNFPVTQYFWTASSIVYYWIKGDPERFKIFVKNRVKEIQKLSDPCEWLHTPGTDNPADIISRGLTINELKSSKIWWQGPSWLIENKNNWPEFSKPNDHSNVTKNKENLELKKSVVIKSTTVSENQIEEDLIKRYSSFSKLIRVTAWCLRFLHNCKLTSKNRKKDHLSVFELQIATKLLVKSIQMKEFQFEIKYLKKKQYLPKNNKLLSLNVFLDKEDLLRVGGRLNLSELPDSQKHPLLLPKTHHFTDLVIEYFHKKSLHSGVQTTLSLIRQLYWIPSGQARVRRVIKKCMTCFRVKNQTIHQMMGDLPRDRIVPSRPFDKVGIDFAGPIITKPNLKRSKITIKSYIAIFICFSTKATHLEVVSDLTTEAFLACLRRFIARPSIIWSDNATNFKGANAILNPLFKMCKSNTVQNFSTEEGIQWNFIPPASPNFGGLWEANIKSMKNILLKVAKTTVLNFEELTTLVTQIEAILNSRPLCPLSVDPTDLQPLTPGHFLVGSSLLSFPEQNTAVGSLSSRGNLLQDLKAKFWSRWSLEYLSELQPRKKWRSPQPNLQEGQLVILKEGNKPLQWNLARINKVIPGEDGLVRVVEVKTAAGVFRRAISKVVPLPLPEFGQPSNGGRDVPV
ncbi:hypothetical protein AVEN_211376-1 [Araneus ventricosus]|uniref:Uncharacterized protein n=1 Tax=Araneus ventricosus TaxID=182803 RepID=A0A4Y2P1U9_ARAVE|nr:hypothetical protein AVEN_211376-1 [Araneus ventricosus]